MRLLHHRLMPNRPSVLKIGRFGRFEMAYRDQTADVKVLAQSFENDIFFAGMPEYRPAEDHVILDVGAHIGAFALLAGSFAPQGKVYAVEACLESHNLCRINVTLNRAGNIDVSHLALSDRRGECVLHYDVGNWGHSIVAPLTGRGETVPTETLSGFLEAKRIDRCHFMKMNCEGAEFPILLSTPPDVLKRLDAMLVLYHCDLYKLATDADLLAHLKASGFDTTVRKRTAQRGWIIAQRQAA